jgi:thiol-disulfide isomerase/thioredoxin
MTAMLRTTVLLALATTLAAQNPTTVPATVKVADPANREVVPPLSPISERVTLAAKAPTGVTAPTDLADAKLGAVKVGGKSIAVAVGKGKADAARTDTLWLDANADGKWTDDERHTLEVSEVPGRGNAPGGERGTAIDTTVALGAAKVPVKALYMKMGERDPAVTLAFPSYLEAKVKVGDQDHVIGIVDKDFDGTYGSKDDVWALAKADSKRPASGFALSLLGEKRFSEGHLVGITVEKGDTAIKVTTTPATGLDAKDAAAHRARAEHQWFENFDKEREGFLAQQKHVDPKRARAPKPIAWNYVTFDQAMELGKKANKPVFIDVMAFWCVWCYRMDYYTYVDQEVADVLNTQFVPCKVIQEQDFVGDYDKLMKEKLQAQGIPAMGIFHPNGTVLVKIGGWKAATDNPDGRDEESKKGFLTKLREGVEAFQAVK